MNADHTTHSDDVERRLGAALHGSLDPIHASADLSAASVARSRQIRRTRHIAAGAALTVAALAIAAPVAWSTLRGGPDVPALPATATEQTSLTTSSGTPTSGLPTSVPTSTRPTPSTAPTGESLSGSSGGPTTSSTPPANVPTHTIPDAASTTVSADRAFAAGPAEGAVWASGKTLHRDGRTVTLAVGDTWDYVPLAQGNGLVVDGAFEADRTVRLVGPDGRPKRALLTIPAQHGFNTMVASADGTRVALYAYGDRGPGTPNDALLYAWDENGTQLAAKDNLVQSAHLAGWYDGRLFLGNHDSGHSYAWDLRTNSVDTYYTGGAFTTVAAGGRAAAYTPIGDGLTGCTEIIDLTGAVAQRLSRACGDFQSVTSPNAFSPDGRSLAGSSAYQDGAGPSVVKVLDTTTGRISLAVQKGLFQDFAFLPDGSLVMDVLKGYGSGSVSEVIARCTVAGTCTGVTAEVGVVDELNHPMRLLTP